MRIKQTLALHNEYPKANITDHDDDKITYSDLYSALMYASKDMRSYTDAYTAGTMDTIGFVTDALKDNGSLSAKEYQDLLDKIIKTWGAADSNGKKE